MRIVRSPAVEFDISAQGSPPPAAGPGRLTAGGSFEDRAAAPAAEREPRALADRRVGLFLGMVALGLFVIFFRLGWLQLVEAERFQSLRDHQTKGKVPHARARLPICWRDGALAAHEVSCQSLYVEPNRIGDRWTTALRLGTALRRPPTEILPYLQERFPNAPDRICKFRWIQRRMTDEEAARVRAFNLPGVGFRSETLRVYPFGSDAAQVLGIVGIDGQGLDGVELSMDVLLQGAQEKEEVLRDALRRPIALSPDAPLPPADGVALVLTLHRGIQSVVEEELDRLVQSQHPSWACAVAMDPATGDVLAMANRPTFDPNAFGQAAPEARRNRLVTDSYEPGSTFKPFILSALLEEGLIRMDDVVECENGLWSVGGRRLHDHHPYGRLSVLDVIAKSSNIGAAKLGLLLVDKRGPEFVRRTLRSFGFGERTGVPLPSESPGRVPAAERWSVYTSTSIPIGHEVAVTPLQLARAYAVFANGGYRVVPRLVRGVVDGSGRFLWTPPASPPVRVLRAETVSQVRRALVAVVESGTATKARLNGYEIAGKTGTTQKFNPATRRYDGGYIASFAAFAPADEARLCILVVVDDPQGGDYYGGKVAAPVAARMIERSLQLLEVPPRPGGLARSAAGR